MSTPPQRFVDGRHTCKPRKYARRDDLPDTPEAKAIVVGVEDCLRAPPLPQARTPNLTGVWEDDAERVTVAINHSGGYIALWISGYTSAKASHFLGKGAIPNFIMVEPRALTKTVGKLLAVHPRIPNAVQLDLRGAGFDVYTLVQVNRKMTLSDRALAYFGSNEDGDLVRRLEHAPIPHRVLRETEEILTGPKMHALLEAFFAAPVSHQKTAQAREAVKRIENHVRTLGHRDHLASNPDPTKPWTNLMPGARTIFLRHVQAVMMRTPSVIAIAPGFFSRFIGAAGEQTTKSVCDRLVDVIATCFDPIMIPQPQIPGILGLGLPRPNEEPRFVYNFEVDGTGIAGDAGVGIAAFRGTLKVQQVEPSAREPFSLRFMLLGGSAGFSVGARVGFRANGVGRSPTAWAREDFLGRFSVYEETVDTAVVVGKSAGFTEWSIRGSGGRPPMSVFFDTADTVGLEYGGGYGAAEGYIRLDDGGFNEMFVPPEEGDDYVMRYQASSDVHFDLGSATLSQEARHILGFMAAAELAGMRSATSELRLVGSADRVDVRWYNEGLSTMRAENTLQALEDSLGPDLGAKTVTRGLGEDLAILMGDADKTENPEARRVFVMLNGRTIATLRGGRSEIT